MSTLLIKLTNRLLSCMAAGFVVYATADLAALATTLDSPLSEEHRYQEHLAARSMMETEIRLQKINYALSRESVPHCGANVKKSIGALVYDLKQPQAWHASLPMPAQAVSSGRFLVLAVYDDSPAAAAGINPGDVIENEHFPLADRLFERDTSPSDDVKDQAHLQLLAVRTPRNELTTKSVWATDTCAHFVRAFPSPVHDVLPVNGGVLLTKGFISHSTDEQVRIAIALHLHHAIYGKQATPRFTLDAAAVWDRLFSPKKMLDEFRSAMGSTASRRAGDEFAIRLLGNSADAKRKTVTFLRKIAVEYPAYLQETSLNREISVERLVAMQS